MAVTVTPDLVAHLYRRAGFGATPAEIAAGTGRSWDDLVDSLLAGLHETDTAGDAVPLPRMTTIPEANVPGYVFNQNAEWYSLITWWIQRMIVTDTPLREKLTLLLHCQFPTSVAKVQYSYLMHAQNQIFRTIGKGSFETLTKALAVDPSMLIWLDAGLSHKIEPNQNFARELMERFTMGIGNYSENDVIQAARCFTGWELDRTTGDYYFNSYDHDDGTKRVLGHVGNLSGQDVITITTNTAASHRWVISRLWSWLAWPVAPSASIVTEFVAAYSRNLELGPLVAAMLRHPAFRSTAALQGLVKQPIEYVVGALRTLGLQTDSLEAGSLSWRFRDLGQQPFAPPSVGGWGDNTAWLTTAAGISRLSFASALALAADTTSIEAHAGDPAGQVRAVARLLGLQRFTTTTLAGMTSLATSFGKRSDSWAAQQLLSLALVSPEYLAN